MPSYLTFSRPGAYTEEAYASKASEYACSHLRTSMESKWIPPLLGVYSLVAYSLLFDHSATKRQHSKTCSGKNSLLIKKCTMYRTVDGNKIRPFSFYFQFYCQFHIFYDYLEIISLNHDVIIFHTLLDVSPFFVESQPNLITYDTAWKSCCYCC